MERQQIALAEQEGEIAAREAELNDREAEISANARDLQDGLNRLERDAHNRVREILRSKTEVQALIRVASKDAVQRSRATLLGKLLERLAPAFEDLRTIPATCVASATRWTMFYSRG